MGTPLQLTTAETVEQAEGYLQKASEFDVIFMDYKLDCGQTAVSSGLVKTAVDSGFGIGRKPLIAYSQGHNDKLLEAGCSHACSWFDLDELVCELFAQQERDEAEKSRKRGFVW